MEVLKILFFLLFTTVGSVSSKERSAKSVLRLPSLSSSLSSISSSGGSINVAQEQEKHKGRGRGRNLIYATGDLKVLVVMINPDALSITESEVKKYLFGDTNSASSQFLACSQGQLRITEFDESPISYNTKNAIQSYDYLSLFDNELVPFLKSKYGVDQISKITNQILFVIPKDIKNPGSNTGWARSPGSDVGLLENYVPSVMNSLHEMGHNYGLDHAHESGAEYEDQSTAMGAQVSSVVNICFNGYHMYKMDWFWERSMMIDEVTNNGDLLKIAFVEDYKMTKADEYLWVAIDEKIFLSFNRKRGINSQTVEHGDMLLVNALQYDNDSEKTPGTELLAALDADSEPYTYANFQNGQNLVIEVCSFTPKSTNNPDYLTVAVGTIANLCNTATMAPNMNRDWPTTATAQQQPTFAPTLQPVLTSTTAAVSVPVSVQPEAAKETTPVQPEAVKETTPAEDDEKDQQQQAEQKNAEVPKDDETIISGAVTAVPGYNEWWSLIFLGCYVSAFVL